ncbi:MAG: ATP-binding cassette domain-containing protein [Thermoleophilia bacterium]|nr:ATP-binding cassette domain-containing protein [Thermoleophilia bacterium]
MTTPAVETQDLVREYRGGIRAVDGVSLTVRSGGIFGFLGPNGAGKSTMVRMLTTLLRPTSGTAVVAGHDVMAHPQAVRRRIGVALQDAAIDPYMTGRELLRLQGVLHSLPRADCRRRADTLLGRLQLDDAADRRVGTYSGGMRRRLDLALSLIHEPEVLFLDEPTTGLDPTSRVTLWEEVRRLNAEHGTTIFLTTQYLEEADQLADRVAIIDDGRIVADGSPAALKADIGHPLLTVTAGEGSTPDDIRRVLASFGEIVPGSTPHGAGVRLPGGSASMGDAVRALDDAGVHFASLDLAEPTLDDVFLSCTGRHLTTAGDETASPA